VCGPGATMTTASWAARARPIWVRWSSPT